MDWRVPERGKLTVRGLQQRFSCVSCGCAKQEAAQKFRKPKRRPKDNRRLIVVDGVSRSITECAALAGISREAMRNRINRCIEHDLDFSVALQSGPATPWQIVGTKH